MTTSLNLDPLAQRTRKYWLRYSIFLWILLPLISLSEVLFGYFSDSPDSEQLTLSLVNLSVSVSVFLGLYCFAYKRPGTKLFYLSVVFRVWPPVSNILDLIEDHFNSFTFTMLMINVVLLTGWIYIGWKLTRLNKKMHASYH